MNKILSRALPSPQQGERMGGGLLTVLLIFFIYNFSVKKKTRMCTTISKHLSPPSVHDHVYSSQWKFWCVAGTNMWECISCFMHMYPNPEFESMTPLPVLIQWWQRTFVIYMWLFFFSTRYAGSNCAGATGCGVHSCTRSMNSAHWIPCTYFRHVIMQV